MYVPSVVDYFDTFERLLETYLPVYDHFLIMGDFNTCLLRNDKWSRKLKHMADSLNINILESATTYHTRNSDSLLDLIFTSNLDRISCHGQYGAPGFSHHDDNLCFLQV